MSSLINIFALFFFGLRRSKYVLKIYFCRHSILGLRSFIDPICCNFCMVLSMFFRLVLANSLFSLRDINLTLGLLPLRRHVVWRDSVGVRSSGSGLKSECADNFSSEPDLWFALWDFVQEWNSRPDTTTGDSRQGDSRRHDILWWYHVNKWRAMTGNRSELAPARRSPRCHVNTP